MLILDAISKSYITPEGKLTILNNLNVTIQQGEFVAIMGPSGSGKSTFLGIAAGLDRPDAGRVIVDGVDISAMKEKDLAKIRSEKIGFIFQNFQLIKNLTALENVTLPLLISGKYTDKEMKEKALFLLQKVSLENRISHYPSQLSGGEEQRVAIARAFVNNPKLLFADEPTGNLDAINGNTVMNMLVDLNKTMGSTLVIVTHDPSIATLTGKTYEMKSGQLIEKYEKQTELKEKKRITKKKISKS